MIQVSFLKIYSVEYRLMETTKELWQIKNASGIEAFNES